MCLQKIKITSKKVPKRQSFFFLTFILISATISLEAYLRIFEGKRSATKHIEIGGSSKHNKNFQFTLENEIGETIEICTDKYGFRNENKIYDDVRKKVLVLGDSYVLNANSSHKKSLTERLNQGSKKFAFINAGASGYSNLDMLQVLDFFVKRITIPQKVLCFIYLGNDLGDNYRSSKKNIQMTFLADDKSQANRPSNRISIFRKLKRFATKSVAIRWLNSKFHKIRNASDQYFSYFYGEAELYRNHPNKEFYSTAINSTDQIFKKFKDIDDKHNLDLTFVLIPSKAQVYGEFKLIDKYQFTKDADPYLIELISDGYDFKRHCQNICGIDYR